MRFGKIALLSVFTSISLANAQDVVVDLSVLDDLDVPQMSNTKPLFPVLPKKAKVEVKKQAVKPKAVVKNSKKAEVKKKVEPVKPLDDDIVVVDVEPVSPPMINNETIKPVIAQTKDVKLEPVNQALPKVAEQPEKVIEKDTNVEANADLNKVSAPIEDKQEPDTALLIQEKTTVEPSNSYIKFGDGIDQLDDKQKVQIDEIVSKYENQPKNKIAIYSYNYDNGEDSFKKKRISLNRAIEIRSYLLKKGYKNFSIKVVNINNSSDKLNTVELQEI